MRKVVFFTLPLFLLLILANSSLAGTTETGNATDNSTVETNVQGSGNVSTHIETTVNGQTNIIDTQGNGETKVENNNGKVTVTKSPEVTIVQTLNSTPTPKIIYGQKPKTPSLVSGLFEKLTNFLSRILHNL
jgi:hypothetical protein